MSENQIAPAWRAPDWGPFEAAAPGMPRAAIALRTMAAADTECRSMGDYRSAVDFASLRFAAHLARAALKDIPDAPDAASSAPAALEPATPESMTREAESLLRRARDLLAKAGAPRAADKVRAAIKSAGGAVRHAAGKATRQPERGT